ncbi:hypothetical protein [Dawidia soli]|uniref:PKD domain-containing protein n=1 Tax=Dawidia soli TaxID=2782352 RepID=A0AAP2DCZ8_9BACT|nr:hypothetical protein [Dawidia soli]MBT1689087.1 hypothetical protein [Dawidia soli]
MKKQLILATCAAMLTLVGCQETEVSKGTGLTQPELQAASHLPPPANFSDVSSPAGRVALAPTKYITQVFEYSPAPGQFINKLPVYAAGNNAAAMAAKAATALVGKTNGLVCLGAFGGYIVVGFDHTIANVTGKDFKVYGNAFADWSEAGIVMVSRDVNGNGLPDDVWYELAGSEYSNVNTIHNYSITYTKPSPLNADVPWTDNQGNSGVVKRNSFHTQASYYPQWQGNTITFTGTRVWPNAYDSDPSATEHWVAPAYAWGYTDNVVNTDTNATFDISWAVNASGTPVTLTGIDFVKVYTATIQDAGWLGEVSTEIAGIEDINIP